MTSTAKTLPPDPPPPGGGNKRTKTPSADLLGPCPRSACGATRGEPCVDRHGEQRPPHSGRTRPAAAVSGRPRDGELEQLQADLDDLDPHWVYGAVAMMRQSLRWVARDPEMFLDLPAPDPVNADTVRARVLRMYTQDQKGGDV